MQEELKPLEFLTNLAEVREEMERQIARMFHIDAALLSGGDPFGEPSYVEAERIRRRSIQELRRLGDEISR